MMPRHLEREGFDVETRLRLLETDHDHSDKVRTEMRDEFRSEMQELRREVQGDMGAVYEKLSAVQGQLSRIMWMLFTVLTAIIVALATALLRGGGI